MNNKYMYILDMLMITGMIFLPALTYLLPQNFNITYIDEIIYLLMLIIVIFKTKQALVADYKLFVAVGLFIIYNVFLVFYNNLPIYNMIQILISMKFLIVFYYFYLKPHNYKYRLFKGLMGIFVFTIFLTMFLSIFEFLITPNLYENIFSIYRDGRGINGIFLTSFFHSRSMFASYILIIVVLVLALKSKKNIRYEFPKFKSYYLLLLILIVMILLSFSRKELLIALMLIIYPLVQQKKMLNKIILSSFAVLLIIGFAYIFNALYSDVNQETLGNENYIRYNILHYGMEIFNYYFPFGSGPGTYGTVLSREYKEVYYTFNVTQDVLGHDGKLSPIYDFYIVSILAEYGMGFLFYILFLYRIYCLQASSLLIKLFAVKRLTIMYILIILILVVLTPVFTNLIGYIIFMLLGLTHQRRTTVER